MNLPWIDLEDNQNAYQVIKFLPENPLILEGGACGADDIITFKKIWPKSTIYIFEPNPLLFKVAQDKIKDYKDVYLYPYALSDSVGEKVFYMSNVMPQMSSFFQDNAVNVDIADSILKSVNQTREDFRKGYDDKPTTVQCITIDEWRIKEGVDHIDYLWLDIEGAELMALKGAASILPEVKVLYVEMNFQEFRKGMVLFDELYDFITSNGFEIYVIWRAHKNWIANGIFLKKNL